MSKCNKYRGGYIAPYSSSPNSSEYMLQSSVNADAIANIHYANNKAEDAQIYVPPTATPIMASPNTPGIQGGSSKKAMDSNDKMKLDDTFYYSLEGGCACNSVAGGNNKKVKGGDFVLTPFISALALLGARMLADKNSGFKMNEFFDEDKKDEDEFKGGKKALNKSRKMR